MLWLDLCKGLLCSSLPSLALAPVQPALICSILLEEQGGTGQEHVAQTGHLSGLDLCQVKLSQDQLEEVLML